MPLLGIRRRYGKTLPTGPADAVMDPKCPPAKCFSATRGHGAARSLEPIGPLFGCGFVVKTPSHGFRHLLNLLVDKHLELRIGIDAFLTGLHPHLIIWPDRSM